MRVLVIFRKVGRHERKVHEQLEKFKVQNGAGREWFQTDLSSIYFAMGRVSEGTYFPTPVEWCNNVGDYITLTQSALEASDAAEIRSAIAGAAKLTKQQVDESLRMDGFKAVTTHHYIRKNGKSRKTSKRVCQKGERRASLFSNGQWEGDELSDSSAGCSASDRVRMELYERDLLLATPCPTDV